MPAAAQQLLQRFSLEGRTAAVTGASSGIGLHIARVLSQAGAKVVLGARRMPKVRAAARAIQQAGGDALPLQLDVCARESLHAFLQAACNWQGRLDLLVNNAGIQAGAKTYATMEEADWDSVINTNLRSAWLASKLYTENAARLISAGAQKEGCIINIGSITAWRTIKGQFPYAVSKAGLQKATEVMALEGAKYGVRVNALAPGYVLTDLSRELLESPRAEAFRKGIPLRRYGAFADLDGPLLLLASDAGRYMTGTSVVVDGGHLCAEL